MNAPMIAANQNLIASRDLVDPLTGIRNRRGFMDGANALVDTCRRAGVTMVLIEVEIAEFEESVRTHGHRHGDGLLRVTAGLIDGISRAGDLAGRTGMAQFSLLLPGVSLSLADQVGDRLTAAADRLSGQGRSGALASRRLSLGLTQRYVDLDQSFG